MPLYPRVSASTRVNMVVALKAEARSLIARYQLKPLGQPGLYANDSGNLGLVICGIGRVNAGRAVNRIHATCADAAAAWLNIGIAGHGTALPGTALLVSEILERTSGRRLYPLGTITTALATTALCTVDEPEADYHPDWAYDMEGSGFLEAAIRISSPQPVQCLKIVSDGPSHSLEELSAEGIEELVGSCVEVVDRILSTLAAKA